MIYTFRCSIGTIISVFSAYFYYLCLAKILIYWALQCPLREITKVCITLSFAAYHSIFWLVHIVDTAMPGNSVIFLIYIEPSKGTEDDDDAERASNAYVKRLSVLRHIHVHTSCWKLIKSPKKQHGMQNLKVYGSKKSLWQV